MIERFYMLLPGERLLYAIMAGGVVLLPFVLWKWVFNEEYYRRFRERRNSFSPFEFILLLLVWWMTNMLLGRFMGMFPESGRTVYEISAMLATQILIVPLGLYICKRRFDRGLGEGGLGLTTRHLSSDIMLATACIIVVLPMCNIMAGILTQWLKLFPSFHLQEHVLLRDFLCVGIVGKILIVLSAAVGAPLFEEIFFRGILQSMLRRVLSPWVSIMITGVFFTLVHPEIQNWPSLLLLAVALGWAYEKTGRITLPIIIHSMFNAIYISAYILGVPPTL